MTECDVPVAPVAEEPYVADGPYATALVETWSVVQVTVAEEPVMLLTATLEIRARCPRRARSAARARSRRDARHNRRRK